MVVSCEEKEEDKGGLDGARERGERVTGKVKWFKEGGFDGLPKAVDVTGSDGSDVQGSEGGGVGGNRSFGGRGGRGAASSTPFTSVQRLDGVRSIPLFLSCNHACGLEVRATWKGWTLRNELSSSVCSWGLQRGTGPLMGSAENRAFNVASLFSLR